MFNIIVSSDPKYPVNKNVIKLTAVEVLQRYNVSAAIEIGISIVGDKKMHAYNKQFRGVDETTNILTFALDDLDEMSLAHLPKLGFIAPDKVARLGDILISYKQAEEDAKVEGVTVEEELRMLVEHGVKHLLGQHHD